MWLSLGPRIILFLESDALQSTSGLQEIKEKEGVIDAKWKQPNPLRETYYNKAPYIMGSRPLLICVPVCYQVTRKLGA